MATSFWIGDAQTVTQVDTLTPASVGIGDIFTVTINGKSIEFTATAGTVANVTAGLVALLAASEIPEFAEIAWANATTAIMATAETSGSGFTLSTSASGGTATFTKTSTTANSGPGLWSVAANHSGGAVPSSSDTVWLSNSSSDINDGLDQSSVTLTALNVEQSFTGDMGRPDNTGTYNEYRNKYLAISATTVNVGMGNGSGSQLLRLDTGSNATTVNVFNTGSSSETNYETFLWKGTHASNVVNVTRGSVGIAVKPGETATIATLRSGYQTSVESDANVRLGPGVTLTTVDQSGGTVACGSSFTTLKIRGGTYTANFAAAGTTINLDGGSVIWQSSGNITTLVIGSGGTFDASQDMRPITITNCTVNAGATLNDPHGRITFSNGIIYNRCDPSECNVNFGTNRTITVS
jgi:hypothetical protein